MMKEFILDDKVTFAEQPPPSKIASAFYKSFYSDIYTRSSRKKYNL